MDYDNTKGIFAGKATLDVITNTVVVGCGYQQVAEGNELTTDVLIGESEVRAVFVFPIMEVSTSPAVERFETLLTFQQKDLEFRLRQLHTDE